MQFSTLEFLFFSLRKRRMSCWPNIINYWVQVISFLVTIDVNFAFTPHFILSHRGGWIVDQIFRSGHICLVKIDVLLCFPLTLKLFSRRVPCHASQKLWKYGGQISGDGNFTIIFSPPFWTSFLFPPRGGRCVDPISAISAWMMCRPMDSARLKNIGNSKSSTGLSDQSFLVRHFDPDRP